MIFEIAASGSDRHGSWHERLGLIEADSAEHARNLLGEACVKARRNYQRSYVVRPSSAALDSHARLSTPEEIEPLLPTV